jgi:hypothetical protein
MKTTVIFLHLTRTGGINLTNILLRRYKREYKINQFQKGDKFSVKNFIALPQHERDQIELLRGHMPFGLHAYFTHPYLYITFLRDPIERVLSEYAATRAPKNSRRIREYEKIADFTLRDFVMSDLDAVNNYQTRVLSGEWSEPYQPVSSSDVATLLETAKKNLQEYFAVVGITERFDETLLVLKRTLGLKNIQYPGRSNSLEREEEATEEIKQIILEKNRADVELYRFANELLNKEVLDYGVEFEHDLRRLRQNNRNYSAILRAKQSIILPVKSVLRKYFKS